MRRCRGCGVPAYVSRGLTWRGNGVITQRRDPDHRMLFNESENLDQLFDGIEEIIGLPLEHIVIESKRRETREYVEKLIPYPARRVARYVGLKAMIGHLGKTARAYGFGEIGLLEKRVRFRDDDYVTMWVRNPHCLLFYCGENLGAWEALDGRESRVEYEEASPGSRSYKVTNRIGPHPVELSDRLAPPRYSYKAAAMDLERCPACGIPRRVASCRWDLDSGIITDPATGRRMAIYGPSGLEAVLMDLEAELGEAIPEAVIESQRRYTRRTFRREELEAGQESVREMLAVRGLGYLSDWEYGDEGLRLVLQNACMPLIMVGFFRGAYEITSGREESSAEWEFRPDGDLVVEIVGK